jgi:AAA domain
LSRSPEEILAGLPEVKVEPRRERKARDGAPKSVKPAAVQEAHFMLLKTPPAIEGQGGQAHTGVVCIRTLALIPDPEMALDVMRGWNSRCQPPWDEDELLDRLQRAAVEADVAPGSRAEMAEARAQALSEAQEFAETGNEGGSDVRAAWNFSTLAQAQDLPEPTWHFPNLLPSHGMGVIYGEPEKGKTWLVLDLAFRLSTGLGGLGRAASDPVDVVLYAGEGIRGIATKRAAAWFSHHGVDRANARLLLTSNPPDVSSQSSMDAFAAGIRQAGFNPGLIVFDTYARALAEAGLSENDPGDVMQYVKAAEALKQHFDAMVLAIHHSGKDAARGARGSNSLRGAIDVEWEVDADWEGRRIIATCTKMKDWERPSEPLHFAVVDVAGTGGIVLEPANADEYKGSKRKAVTRAEIGQALRDGGVMRGVTWTTKELALALAGEHCDKPNVVNAKVKALKRDEKTRFASYVTHFSSGPRDSTLWAFPEVGGEGLSEGMSEAKQQALQEVASASDNQKNVSE